MVRVSLVTVYLDTMAFALPRKAFFLYSLFYFIAFVRVGMYFLATWA